MATALEKIRARAKAIRKDKPKMSYINAIKAAGADYRAGRLGAVKKTGVKKSVTVKRKVSGTPVAKKVKRAVSRVGTVGKVTRSTTVKRETPVQRGNKIINKINAREKKYSTLVDKEKKYLLASEINSLHKQLDVIKKSLNKR